MAVIDWTAVGSVAASIGVVVAVSTMIAESRRARFAQAIDILMQLDSRFEAPEFRETRRRAAAYLISKSPKDDAIGKQALADLLNFFESLGCLFRRKAVDADMIWHTFATWLLPYYKASHAYVERRQADDPNCFKECQPLYEAVLALEDRERNYRTEGSVISKPSIDNFLQAEADLPVKYLPPAPAG